MLAGRMPSLAINTRRLIASEVSLLVGRGRFESFIFEFYRIILFKDGLRNTLLGVTAIDIEAPVMGVASGKTIDRFNE